MIFSFTNVTDAPLTVHTLPSVTLCDKRGTFPDSPRREETIEPELAEPFTLAPGERRELPFLLAGKTTPNVHTTLLFSEPVMLGGELRALRLPPIEIPLLDFSGDPLFFDPLPPDNCELLQERERVEP